ncbi:MAG: hypothetical protein ACR2M3_19540 [Thermomicrobiales bacterium]
MHRGDAIVISISREAYDALIERLEDLEGSISILEARIANEPARPLDEFVRERRMTWVAEEPGH